jgi:hypothetical protein
LAMCCVWCCALVVPDLASVGCALVPTWAIVALGPEEEEGTLVGGSARGSSCVGVVGEAWGWVAGGDRAAEEWEEGGCLKDVRVEV